MTSQFVRCYQEMGKQNEYTLHTVYFDDAGDEKKDLRTADTAAYDFHVRNGRWAGECRFDSISKITDYTHREGHFIDFNEVVLKDLA